MTDRQLARLVAQVAADLDARGYHAAGVVRQAARALLDGQPDGDDGGCCGCGRPVTHTDRGRPRKWCGERCRRRHRP